MHVCTIAAKNYLAPVRVLARSFAEHHPEGTCWVLIVDGWEGWIDPPEEPFRLVPFGDLGIGDGPRMAAGYDVLEFSTAVKPWLLRWLLARPEVERITYLDPDIQVFAPLEQVDELLREHPLVLNPHRTAPLPRDGLKPSETDILIAGAFNLGFVGMARGTVTQELLAWWQERLRTDCIVDPERGYFVDQRWMDFAPGLVPAHHVLRDPGYNTAYWSLPGRTLARGADGRVTVDGSALRFFHFSGYDPERPGELSRHQTRLRLERDRTLRELCDGYAAALVREGHARSRSWPYDWAALPDGTPLTRTARRLYREGVQAGALRDENVFAPPGTDAFLHYLREPAPDAPNSGISRYLGALREEREDLRIAFPQLDEHGARELLAWAQAYGATTGAVPPALLPLAAGSTDGAGGAGGFGVNVVGYFDSVLGVGEHARQLAAGLESQGVPVARVPVRSHRDAPEVERGSRAAPFGVNLVCVNADVLPGTLPGLGHGFNRARTTIGFWAWEVSSFPECFGPAFQHVQEVWAGSRHTQEALALRSPVPVIHVPQPVGLAERLPVLSRKELGVPQGFLVLFLFDFASVLERKNPLAAIRAFTRAFGPGEGAVLVLKTLGGDERPAERDLVRAAVAEHPHVHLLEGAWPVERRDALLAAGDAYLSLHRAEGFGYTMAEAMWMGKPVIATGYSGNADYMTTGNSWPVPYALVPIGPGQEPYPADGEWAEPDEEQAAQALREVFENPDEARRRGARAAEDIRRTHGVEAAGRVMTERLRMVTWPRGFARRGSGTGVIATRATERLRRRIEAGPQGHRQPRFGEAQVRLREGMLRALKPVTAHEQMITRELLHLIEGVDVSLQGLASSQLTLRERLDAQEERLDAQEERLGALDLANTHPLAAKAWPVAPQPYWSEEYLAARLGMLERALSDPELLLRFRKGRELPDGYGVGWDERLVELPWILSRDLSGRLLDAGSTLNRLEMLIRLRPRVDELLIVTLAPEPEAHTHLDVSYLYADLQDLPLRDASVDCAVSISTLEHVGFDNVQYGAAAGSVEDPDSELAAALGELRRVLRPGGRLWVTVPLGLPEDLGWERVFSPAQVEELIVEPFAPAEVRREGFLYGAEGWRRAGWEETTDARYRRPEEPPAEDRAAAARAVACLELRR